MLQSFVFFFPWNSWKFSDYAGIHVKTFQCVYMHVEFPCWELWFPWWDWYNNFCLLRICSIVYLYTLIWLVFVACSNRLINRYILYTIIHFPLHLLHFVFLLWMCRSNSSSLCCSLWQCWCSQHPSSSTALWHQPEGDECTLRLFVCKSFL